MKNIILSLLICCSFAVTSNAKQTVRNIVSNFTDWCYTGGVTIWFDWGWVEVENYKECGGTATMTTVEMYPFDQP